MLMSVYPGKERNMRISVRKKSNPAHTRLSVWVNGGLITDPFGICLRKDEADEFIARLRPDSIMDEDERPKPAPR